MRPERGKLAIQTAVRDLPTPEVHMEFEVFDDAGAGWEKACADLPPRSRDPFASPAYYRAFAATEKGALPECAVLRDGRGILLYPYFRRMLSEIDWLHAPEGSCDIMTAYGYGGIYGDTGRDDLLDDFIVLFGEHCARTGVVAELIRLNPLLGSESALSRHFELRTGNRQVVVDLRRSDDEIWRGYRHNNRKNVNKALRSGVEVIQEQPLGPHFGDFLSIYASTMDRRGADRGFHFPDEFYRTLAGRLGDGCRVFYALAGGTTVSAEMVLTSATAVYSILGGTREEFFELRPNNLLKHRIVLWARDAGYESFLLGGGPGGEDGIFDYKKSFASEGILDFHLACRVHDESLYGTLVERCMEHPRTAVPGAERYFLRWRYGG